MTTSPPSDRDRLTGLVSASAGRAILQGSINHNGRVALLLCDIDRLKPINDIFGSVRGDKELSRVARDLKRVCGNSTVFRLGGDEFGIVLHEVSLGEAREVAQKILASHPPVTIENHEKNPVQTLSLSIGIALFPDQATNVDGLLQPADIALLKAKRGGRLANGTVCQGRNCALARGDFIDEFPEQSARFLNPNFDAPRGGAT